MDKNAQPLFTHDCDCCSFLGSFGNHDLYYCGRGARETIIARYGNEGFDYTSGIVFASVDRHIGEGLKRAKAMGLVKENA